MGTVSEMDKPMKPSAEARDLDRRYFCGITDAMLAADRKALCSVDAAALKAMAAELGTAMQHGTRVPLAARRLWKAQRACSTASRRCNTR